MTVLPVNSDIIIFQFTVKLPARTLRRSAGNLDRFPSFLEDYDKEDENESLTAMVQWDARDRSGRRTGDFIAAPQAISTLCRLGRWGTHLLVARIHAVDAHVRCAS